MNQLVADFAKLNLGSEARMVEVAMEDGNPPELPEIEMVNNTGIRDNMTEENIMRNGDFYSTSEDTDDYSEYRDSGEDTADDESTEEKEIEDMEDNFIDDEIRRLQSSSRMIINRDDFRKVCEDLVKGCASSDDITIDEEALEALQTASEDFLVRMFTGVAITNNHYGKMVLDDTDIRAYMKIHRKNIYY